jgi:myo-inositol-1-phosphate synthase
VDERTAEASRDFPEGCDDAMTGDKVGIWLIGAWGSAGTAVAVALATLQHRLLSTEGLVTEQPEFSRLSLGDWSQFVVGGHEIRKTSTAVEARALFADVQAVSPELLSRVTPSLNDWDRNVRTGTLLSAGPAIEALASSATLKTRGERPAAALKRIALDLDEFRHAASLRHVIVVNVASAEPSAPPGGGGLSCGELLQMLEHADRSPISASALYAFAAIRSGCSYLNVSPSIGSDLPALRDLAAETGSLHTGRGVRTDLVALGLLRRSPVADSGAGQDRLRAGRAVLDLVRLCELEHRRGKRGVAAQLACFFERPMEAGSADVATQVALFREWVAHVSTESSQSER